MKLSDWSDVATIASLLLGGGAAFAFKISGVRVGPLRAVVLALHSKFFRKVDTKSCRVKSVATLKKKLAGTSKSSYIVVEGDKGVGKSCMIDTAVMGAKGVMDVTIPPGTAQKDVTDMCFAAIVGGIPLSFIDQQNNVVRVVKWYRRIFHGSPILILTMSERNRGNEYAQVTGAVRKVVGMDVKVILDASPNSLPSEATSTERQEVLRLEELTAEEMLQLPQLADLFKRLDEAGPNFSTTVLSLLGGNPARCERLAGSLDLPCTDDEIRDIVEMFCAELVSKVYVDSQLMLTREPKFREIFALLKTNTVLTDLKLELPSPCKILRVRKVAGKTVLMPSSPVAALVFQHSCEEDATLKALHNLIWGSSAPAAIPDSETAHADSTASAPRQ